MSTIYLRQDQFLDSLQLEYTDNQRLIHPSEVFKTLKKS